MGQEIFSNAILVRLRIGQAGLSATSKTLTDEAAEKHEADRDSVRGTVQKLKPADRKGITRAINMAKSALYYNTLPYEEPYRLCPAVRYDSLKRALEPIQESFKESVEDLLTRYDTLASDYKNRVKDLAEEVPFPSREELSENFTFKLIEMPITDPSKLRLNHLSEEELTDLRDRVGSDIHEKVAGGIREITFRLLDQVGKIKTQCAKGEDARFFQSLTKNLEKELDVLPSLNVTNDAEIDRLIGRVRKELAQIDVKDLKVNGQVRTKVEKTAAAVMKDLKGYKIRLK